MLPEITCTIKQAGVELATISQTTNLEDLDEALESFDSKFMPVMNKLIQDKGLTDGPDNEESDDSTAEDPESTGPSTDVEASGDAAEDSKGQKAKK